MPDDPVKPDRTESDAPDEGSLRPDTAPTIAPSGDGDAGSGNTLPPPEMSKKSIPPSHPLANRGNRLAGRYELKEIVGEGGMGMVYRAHDLELDEEIAIKVLQRQFTQNPKDVERFKREIKTARRITHINIIRIHDFGIADREAFISMELLTGGTLADRLEAGRIPYDDALSIAIQIARGLAAAHRQGVIHRDIKPHNVLFDGQGTVKLVDFGIARFAAATQATHGVMGTPHYMSPEQADGREVTKQSDVYSLGILMYELFAGKLPFISDSLAKLAVMHVSQEPEAPRTVNTSIPPLLEGIILKCLSKDPNQRFKNGSELTSVLEALQRGEKPAIKSSDPPPPPESERRRSPWTGRLALIAGVAALGFAGWRFGPDLLARLGQTSSATPTAVAGTPTPEPTPVVQASTPAATPTPEPTRKRTPRPTPRPTRVVHRTPRPTPRRTPARTPTPAATEAIPGTLKLKIIPWGYVIVRDSDGKVVGKDAQGTKAFISKLEPGVYTVEVKHTTLPSKRIRVKIRPGREQLQEITLKPPDEAGH